MVSPRTIIIGDSRHIGRTERSLEAAGVAFERMTDPSAESLATVLLQGGPVMLIRAGAWLVQGGTLEFPLPSATGKGLCALGAVRSPRETESLTAKTAADWSLWLAVTGGELAIQRTEKFAEPVVVYLDGIAAKELGDARASSLAGIVRQAAGRCRLVHYPPMDAFDDPGLRVLQVITALQRGGAERVTLDLLAELPGHDVRTRLLTVGRALREAYPTPPGTLELSALTGRRESRGDALLRLARAFGADVIHAHLMTGGDARFLSAAGFPVVVTVHNVRPGWPAGIAELRERDVALVVACAQAVEADARAAGIKAPVRTVWNGIDVGAFTMTPELSAAGRRLRRDWGFGRDDFVLLALANPRPQKRLHRLPAILAALRDALGAAKSTTQAKLAIVGEAANGSAEAAACVADTSAEANRLGVAVHLRWAGPTADPAMAIAAADVLVSTSAHEGLSLAQLEALAMGRPVVATDVGGAREIAQDHPKFHLMTPEADAGEFAAVLARLALASEGGPDDASSQRFRDAWSRRRMAARYCRLYPRAVVAARGRLPKGLWLVTNNFSTGGAQSSARRLLLGLRQAGVGVQAAVIEENPANPTPGRRALMEAGIPVLAVDLPALTGTEALDQILKAIDDNPPEAVLFWNLRPEFKLGLADALLNVRVFDISPGGMLFDSLEKYFARPHRGFPYRNARDYGARLGGVVVKYQAEAERAAKILGSPVHVVPNGIPVPPRRTRDKRDERIVFGTAARIHPQKRLEDLIEAFVQARDRLPPWTLRIAGGVEPGCEDYASRLRAQAAGLPVEWLGGVSDMSAFHGELDIFVMISDPPGCPNASLEALACGLPVIATDVGGASEQVITGQTGVLVPSRNPQAFADALIQLAANANLRDKLGEGARAHIAAHFSLDRMIADYRRVLGI